MKQILDYSIPIYGTGTMVIPLPTSGVVRAIGVDHQTGDCVASVESDVADGYMRPVEFCFSYLALPVDSTYNWIGKVSVNGIDYDAWWRETN